jgi:hypothetical protein
MEATTKQKVSSQSVLTTEALESMDYHLQIARNKILHAMKNISTEDLGEFYITYDKKKKGLTIGADWGSVELEDCWQISFNDLAEHLVNSVSSDSDALSLIEALEKTLKKVKKSFES